MPRHLRPARRLSLFAALLLASPAAATTVPGPPARPPGHVHPAASAEGQWQFIADGQNLPTTARLGWTAEGWNTFVVVLLECDPRARMVRISLDLNDDELARVVTSRIRHGAGTLTLTGRAPTEPDSEGLYWLESVRSYDEIAPALEHPAPWIIGDLVLSDPGTAAAFRGFRLACGISDE